MKLTDEDVALLNSKVGLHALLRNKKVNLKSALKEARYLTQLRKKQEELIKLQNWVIENDQKVVILFEGRDAAGKGGAIRRLTEYINPRHFRIVALDIPSDDERKQWFFQRYINQLPKPGEIVFFDRSWYNRAVVEPVNKFCTEKEYNIFMSHVNDFEKMLIESDTHLIKFYFSINKKEQAKRFKEIKKNPLKRWKMTPVDEKAQDLWDDYSRYKEKMFEQTNTAHAPWVIVDANEKTQARLNAVSHVLKTILYH
ncbi:polyphosphate kinase 2 [Flavobacteriaceae bacterium TP-CH-4]|uniref:ADP/GDP-polyphosphate phosphotransferase n=1 Tax=Pelagihabitans pacificus TaxID=2696054 RepID=A0A967AR28_9FLAO|nr:polyphosphate kinase 2 [Pelagihabitans pacificus]NHF58614.1 polyphosphate kinase 2 [Pelagihabitans pacificus]